MNRFLYAHANPTTLIDPTGHTACGPDGIYCTGTNHGYDNRTPGEVPTLGGNNGGANGGNNGGGSTPSKPYTKELPSANTPHVVMPADRYNDERAANAATPSGATVSGPINSRGACLSGQAGVGVYLGLQVCVGMDARDQIALLVSGEVGGVAGGTASAGVGGFGSTAEDLYHLSNLSGVFGGSVGEVIVGGTETSLAKGPDGSPIVTQTGTMGLGFNLGLGLPPVEAHAGLSQTAVWAADFEDVVKIIDLMTWMMFP
jgi:hypothetical protein